MAKPDGILETVVFRGPEIHEDGEIAKAIKAAEQAVVDFDTECIKRKFGTH